MSINKLSNQEEIIPTSLVLVIKEAQTHLYFLDIF